MNTFRQYARDDLFTRFANVKETIPSLNEYQIALAFARDYDENGNHTNGNFIPYWDTENVTADRIIKFKKENPNLNVNVFISIGDRDARYPFQFTDRDSWVINATNSIEKIINDHFLTLKHIDGIGIGIDVYYENVRDAYDFPYCVGQLIKKLKADRAISLASMAPSFELQEVYLRLYLDYGCSIDFVDYQFYKEREPIRNAENFVSRYDGVALQFPANKLLAGYSSVRNDCPTLAPIVFFIGCTIIWQRGQPLGVSIWDIDSGVFAGWELSLPFGLRVAPEPHEAT